MDPWLFRAEWGTDCDKSFALALPSFVSVRTSHQTTATINFRHISSSVVLVMENQEWDSLSGQDVELDN